MPNTTLTDILYSKGKDPLEFIFDNIPPAPPILSFMTIQDIEILNKTAKSLKYAGNIQKKYDIIDRVMTNRGFVKFHSGTNRIVYRPLESYDFIVKIALDRVGLTDSPNELLNQRLLQPFVTKVFECTPCGTVATFERVKPIIRKEEFASMAGDVFDLINKKIIGKYILDDIGTEYFMNWGLRTAFGPIILDFPYVYELDGDKLMCTKEIPELNYQRCTGLIDYDLGFNNLVCNECGRKYNALDLEKTESGIEIVKGGSMDMKLVITKGDKIISEGTKPGTNHIKRKNKPKEEVKKPGKMRLTIGGKDIDTSIKEDVIDADKDIVINSHEDVMKRRKEIMERQKSQEVKKETVEEPETEEEVEDTVVEKEEPIEEPNEAPIEEEVEGFDNGGATIGEILKGSVEAEEEQEEILQQVLAEEGTLSNVSMEEKDTIEPKEAKIEERYEHLEEEFEDAEVYEKIKSKPSIKDLY